MYEDQTEEVIFKRMMERVSKNIDQREGSIIYDAAMPASIECMLLYSKLDWFIKNTFADTAERPWLIKRAKERGIHSYPASYAIVKGKFTPLDVNLPLGARLSYEDVNYAVTEKISDGVFLLQCEEAGTVGNKPVGTLIPIDYIKGLQTAKLTEVTVPGEDEEGTEHFRQRYLNSFDNQAYGGNIADYREKVNAIQGVGGVKVYPAWQGGCTVRLAFMTSEYKVPTPEFIDKVQTLIDPIPNQGKGLGIAPVGHIVTVEGVRDAAIKIDLEMSFENGYIFEDYRASIEKVIDEYFTDLNRKWESTQRVSIGTYTNTGIVVRISQIESRLLDIEGVVDVQHTKLNCLEENLTLGLDELAVRGKVNGA